MLTRHKRARLVLAAALAAALPGGAIGANVDRMTIWDLKIGTPVAEMPEWIEFKGYACGSNGGPPLAPLDGWADFASCAAEPNGLHEVYFEYDDELEYIRRAHEDMRLAQVVGTSDRSFPIIASALFDDAGILRGLRMVTDPRQNIETDNDAAELRERADHSTYGQFLAGQWGIQPGRDCETLEPRNGETPVGKSFVKLDCERIDEEAGVQYLLAIRHLRKPGQRYRDPRSGKLTVGEFESLAHGEILSLAIAPTEADLPDIDQESAAP